MSRRARAAGFTLVELLVVVVLSSLIVTLGLRAWRPMQDGTLALRDRARDVAQLQLAVDALLADFGAAETVTIGLGGELAIEREAERAMLLGTWNGSADDGVEYALVEDRLERYDVAADATVVVASGLRAFTLEDLGDSLHVTLEVGADSGAREVELVWPE